MSIRIMSEVWQSSPLEGRALLVELALADFANDEGVCWPSIDTLSQKARCSESWVHQIIRDLRKRGRIKVHEGGGRNRPNVYQFTLNPVVTAPFRGQNAGEKGALDAPLGANGAVDSAERVQFDDERVQFEAERVHSTAPDPSLDPSLDPLLRTTNRVVGAILKSRERKRVVQGAKPRKQGERA